MKDLRGNEMEKNKTVTINGRLYDAATGMPVKKAPARKTVERPASAPAAGVHATTERSQTLNRRIAQKKTTAPARKPQSGRMMDIARSPKVARFTPEAPKPEPKKEKPAPVTADHKPVSHPMAERAISRAAAPKPAKVVSAEVTKSLKEIKDEEIEKALSAETPKQKVKKQGAWAKHSRKIIASIAVVVILVVGGYLTLVNLPALSVWVASSQAGIKATYPSYSPDGYSLSQPVSFSDGEVTLNFVSNGGSGGYVVRETRSSWDSTAVLENVVKKTAGEDYATTNDSGLTIYTFNGDAAWVNRGILYTIDSSAPLSNDQIRSIATSL